MPAAPDRLVLPALNHLLAQADWARLRLGAHAGKSFSVQMAGVTLGMAIDAQGLFEPARDREPVLCLQVPASAALALRAGRADARRQVVVSGDAALAADLAYVAAHLDWDAEADLARLFGDIAARRIARTLESLGRVPAQAASSLTRSAARFVVSERAIAPDRAQVDGWAAAVDRTRDDVERLAARISRIEAGLRKG